MKIYKNGAKDPERYALSTFQKARVNEIIVVLND